MQMQPTVPDTNALKISLCTAKLQRSCIGNATKLRKRGGPRTKEVKQTNKQTKGSEHNFSRGINNFTTHREMIFQFPNHMNQYLSPKDNNRILTKSPLYDTSYIVSHPG